MKKTLLILLALTAILALAGPASAWSRHGHGFGFFIAPPPFVPPIFYGPRAYYRPYYPPYGYYDYYGPRIWVPGHWEERWTPYGRERVWIPGYWR